MRRLVLFAATAIAAMATMAGTALAQFDPVEVKDSSSGAVCGQLAVTGGEWSGGCQPEAVLYPYTVRPGGTAADWDCEGLEFGEVHVAGNGDFMAEDVDAGVCSPVNMANIDIPMKACEDDGGVPEPWAGSMGQFGGTAYAFVLVCVETNLPAGHPFASMNGTRLEDANMLQSDSMPTLIAWSHTATVNDKVLLDGGGLQGVTLD